jgi:hypothetical protein
MSEITPKVIAAVAEDVFPNFEKAIALTFGNTQKLDIDLYPFFSLLVTANVNKNLDAFDHLELWKSRHTPEHKPINFMHKENKILGHIVEAKTVDEDLKPIPEDISEGDLPYKLHVLTASVIYKIKEDAASQAEINEIIDKMAKGDYKVSMECLFTDFDYLLMSTNGSMKRIPRNETTNFLTRYLRQYKGPGRIEGKTIARLLKSITFSGCAVVDKPANTDSIISDNLNIFARANEESIKSFPSHAAGVVYINLETSNMELTMAETKTDNKSTADVAPNIPHDLSGAPGWEAHPAVQDLKDAHERLKKDHAALQDRAHKMKEQLDNIHQKTLADEVVASAIKAKEEEYAEKEKKVQEADKEKSEAIARLETANAALKGDNDAMSATIKKFEEATRNAKRTQALMDADNSLSREKAYQMATDKAVAEMADSSFEFFVKTIKGRSAATPKEVTPEKVMSTAKAEVGADVPMGVSTQTVKTDSGVTNWYKSQTNKSKRGK